MNYNKVDDFAPVDEMVYNLYVDGYGEGEEAETQSKNETYGYLEVAHYSGDVAYHYPYSICHSSATVDDLLCVGYRNYCYP